MSKLVEEIPKHCKAVVFLKETGTEKLLSEFPLTKGGAARLRAGAVSPLEKGVPYSDGGRVVFSVKETLKECVEAAMKIAKSDDVVLFSPAFASFGKWFKNEYDRGEQFVELVRRL
jgi:UDP-N-acetylmuramoylalanine-D-glutamate ligase